MENHIQQSQRLEQKVKKWPYEDDVSQPKKEKPQKDAPADDGTPVRAKEFIENEDALLKEYPADEHTAKDGILQNENFDYQ